MRPLGRVPGDEMSDLLDQVTADQDPFRKLVGKIPGFAGYIDRENRRSADKMLRESIADKFEAVRKKLGNVQKDLAAAKDLGHIDDLEGAATKLQTFIDKVRTASYGNSGFFDAIKINADELGKMYQFDLELVTKAEEMDRAVDNVAASVGTDGMDAAVRNVVSLSRDLVSTFDKRGEVITAQ
jgi:hypothetical protein